MAEKYYEGMFILNSGKFGSDPDAAAAEVSGIIEKVGGTVVAHRPWQDSKLAYPMNDHRKGFYYLTFFSAESRTVNDINGIVKLNDNIIRHLIISHDKSLFDQMVELVAGGDAFRHEVAEAEASVTEKKSADGEPAKAAEAAAE